MEDIQAVSKDGEPLWQSFAYDGYVETPPVLSGGESYIFLRDGALASASGGELFLDGLPVDMARLERIMRGLREAVVLGQGGEEG